MQTRTFSTLLASAAILGSSMVGCSGAHVNQRAALTAGDPAANAARIEQRLAGRDFARALIEAEALVAAQPGEAGHRAQLGRAYLANGRYASARQAFNDAMALGNRDPRTIVSLALAETGTGDAASARDLLAAHMQDLPAADYGLAMAMAGDPREGVRALLEASRQPGATAQTRQNLAYALALGGAWTQARLIAGRDLPARDAERRIGEWSRQMADNSPERRVVAMLGVAPRADDAGLPAQLALNQAAAPVDLAAAAADEVHAAAPVPADEAAAREERIAAFSPPPPPSTETLVVATALAGNDASAPLAHAPAEPMRRTLRAAFQRTNNSPEAMVARSSMSRVAPVAGPATDAEASDWVVQLGAYDSEAVAREKWSRISRANHGLGAFSQIHSAFTHDGREYHRLAIRGFDDRAAAQSLCRSLKATGQACFVRLDDTQSTRMARAEAQRRTRMAANGIGSAGQQLAGR